MKERPSKREEKGGKNGKEGTRKNGGGNMTSVYDPPS